MKKRVIAVLTAVLMTASLAGCGSGKLSNDYVTVNKYKGLEVTEVAKNEVSDDSVEQEIQSRLEAAAPEQDVTDRAAQSGDWVNIDYTGTLDGVAFDGGTATGYDLELGSGSFIGASGDYQGFEDQIVGHNTGEEFDITVQFPENYQSSDLAGKPANFHIVLNKIYQKVTPELTDEWVANNSESSKTVDEYKEEVKNSLQEQQDDSGNSQLKQEVQTALLDQFRFQQSPVYGFKDGIINLLLPREAKLHLCRMHIDIYIFSTQMKMQNCKWKLVLHHKITISVFHGFGDHCTFDITAVYEEIFKVAISTCDDRLAEKTCDMDSIFLIIDLNQVSRYVTAIDIVDHIFQFSVSGSTKFFLSVIQKLKSNFRMRQGKVHQEILHMSGFCHWRFQKFSSRRNIVK